MPRLIPDALDNDPLGTRFITAIAIDRVVKKPTKPKLMPMVSVAVVVFRDNRMNGVLNMIRVRTRARAGLVLGTGAIDCGKQNERSGKRCDDASQFDGLFIDAHVSLSLFVDKMGDGFPRRPSQAIMSSNQF